MADPCGNGQTTFTFVVILDLFRKDVGFDNIQGYDDIKNIVRRTLSSEENYNLLLCGPPA